MSNIVLTEPPKDLDQDLWANDEVLPANMFRGRG